MSNQSDNRCLLEAIRQVAGCGEFTIGTEEEPVGYGMFARISLCLCGKPYYACYDDVGMTINNAGDLLLAIRDRNHIYFLGKSLTFYAFHLPTNSKNFELYIGRDGMKSIMDYCLHLWKKFNTTIEPLNNFNNDLTRREETDIGYDAYLELCIAWNRVFDERDSYHRLNLIKSQD